LRKRAKRALAHLRGLYARNAFLRLGLELLAIMLFLLVLLRSLAFWLPWQWRDSIRNSPAM
jgi:hypothetical protein